MNKYLALYRVNLQRTLTYRGPMTILFLSNAMSAGTIILIWLASTGSTMIGGYTKNGLITYYLIAILLTWLINCDPFGRVRDDIKNGELSSKVLIKPISFYFTRLFWEMAWRSVSIVFGIVEILILLLFFHDLFVFPQLDLITGIFLVLSICMAFVIQYTVGVCLGMLNFWFTQINSINNLKWMGMGIFGGASLPISLVPTSILPVIKLLPFRFMFSLPMEIITGKLSGYDLIGGLLIQFMWCVILIGIYKIMWTKGLKVYTSVGQ